MTSSTTNNTNIETFYGYLSSTQDALIVLAASTLGVIPRVSKRLDHADRRSIRSGSIFVFDERESGIKRWTDSKLWSPSRILGDFLVYKEVERKERPVSHSPSDQDSSSSSSGAQKNALTKDDTDTPNGPVTSHKGTYYFKKEGLIKKTMSAAYQGKTYHLISYYTKTDVENGLLLRPTEHSALKGISIPEAIEVHNLQSKKVIKRRHSSDEEYSSGDTSKRVSHGERIATSLSHLLSATEILDGRNLSIPSPADTNQSGSPPVPQLLPPVSSLAYDKNGFLMPPPKILQPQVFKVPYPVNHNGLLINTHGNNMHNQLNVSQYFHSRHHSLLPNFPLSAPASLSPLKPHSGPFSAPAFLQQEQRSNFVQAFHPYNRY